MILDANPGVDTTQQFQQINNAYEEVLKSASGTGFNANEPQQEVYQSSPEPPRYDANVPFGSGVGYNDPDVRRRREQYERHSQRSSSIYGGASSAVHDESYYGPSFDTNRVRPFGSDPSGSRQSTSSVRYPSSTSSPAGYTQNHYAGAHANRGPVDDESPIFFGGDVGFRDTNGERKVVVGADIQSKVEVGFMTGVFGGSKYVQIDQLEPCYPCHGGSCGFCGGRGATETTKEIKVSVPPGIKNGSWLHYPGQGNAGPNKGPTGDLYVVVDVKGSKVAMDVQRFVSNFISTWHSIKFRVKYPIMQFFRTCRSISTFTRVQLGRVKQTATRLKPRRRAPPPYSGPTIHPMNTGTFSFGKQQYENVPFGSGHGYNDPDLRRRREQYERHSGRGSSAFARRRTMHP